jgi:hypothetical protein
MTYYPIYRSQLITTVASLMLLARATATNIYEAFREEFNYGMWVWGSHGEGHSDVALRCDAV